MARIEDSIDDEGNLQISLEDDIDDGGDDDSRGGRRRQRGNRLREAEEANKKYEKDNETLRSEMNTLRSSFDQFRGEANQFANQVERNQQPQESELDALKREERELQVEWNAVAATEQGKDPEVAQRYQAKHQEIRDQHSRVMMREEIARNQPKQQDPQHVAIQSMAATEYADVSQDKKYLGWATGYHQQQLALGRDNNVALAKEAFEASREHFKLGGRSTGQGKPSSSAKAKYEGTPSAGNGAGGEAPKGFKMTPMYRKMADSAYPELPESKRYQVWAQRFLKDD